MLPESITKGPHKFDFVDFENFVMQISFPPADRVFDQIIRNVSSGRTIISG